MLGVGVVAYGVLRHEIAGHEPLAHDHVGHGEGERGVGAGTDEPRLVGVARRLRAPDVDGHDARSALPRRDKVRSRGRLAREIGAPEHDETRVLGHVLLGVGLDDPRDAEPVGPHGPAHDGGVPDLHAAQVAEAHDEGPVDARDVRAVAEPEADALARGRLDRGHDAIEGLAASSRAATGPHRAGHPARGAG